MCRKVWRPTYSHTFHTLRQSKVLLLKDCTCTIGWKDGNGNHQHKETDNAMISVSTRLWMILLLLFRTVLDTRREGKDDGLAHLIEGNKTALRRKKTKEFGCLSYLTYPPSDGQQTMRMKNKSTTIMSLIICLLWINGKTAICTTNNCILSQWRYEEKRKDGKTRQQHQQQNVGSNIKTVTWY